MNTELRNELLNHILETIEDREIDSTEDLHYHCFNESYYIIGHWNAKQWLLEHNIDVLDAVATILEWEENTLGETTLKANEISYERVVNLYVYVVGEELLYEFNLDEGVDNLITAIKAELDND